jgi:predicted glycosyltransferase
MSTRPTLLLYCQHSLGLGHLVRSYALAVELARTFEVVFVRGGEEPRGVPAPDGVEIVPLPALGAVSGVAGDGVPDVLPRRRSLLLGLLADRAPRAVVVELYPFGRKKFASELLPLLEAAREARPRPVAVCSLRDVLVDRGGRQREHDERAAAIANAYFDAVLVHADPAVARLEESFRPRTVLTAPVHYTGFVVPATEPPQVPREDHVLVSAGGGLVGGRLLETAIAARRLLPQAPRLRLVAGPFLPEADFTRLRASVAAEDGIELVRSVPALEAELARASASVSQCGYNTALAVVRSRVPALVVPFEEGPENEQGRRARRLEELGLVRMLPAEKLDPRSLAAELDGLRTFRPRTVDLRLDGTAETAEILTTLAGRARRPVGAGMAWLRPLEQALADAAEPVTFFFRDDDAGWADERLLPLLDRFAAAGGPLDLAVIPQSLEPGLAAELVVRRDAAGVHLGVHQHGFAHRNHEANGRKCEFGPSRSAADQRRDIQTGRTRLEELLGPVLDPVFTPPWNRCTATTGACLVELGFAALSREARAEPLGVDGLAEIPVSVDWFGRRKGLRPTRSELGVELATAARSGGAVGVMLHHAELADGGLEDTVELLRLLVRSDRALLVPMRELLA